MKVTPVRTAKILAGKSSIFEVINASIETLPEKAVVAVSSKIVSLCENNVVPMAGANKENLIAQQSERYLDSSHSQYGHHFTIIGSTLIASAGIDESNGNEYYVLWPRDPQKSANEIRKYLTEKFQVQDVGVVITDSTCHPLRRGTTGISLSHSGFCALNDYRGTPDLFGREMGFSIANVAEGLAATAVLTMGEGTEQTPLALISDIPFVKFQNRDPSSDECAEVHIPLEDDLFAPFLQNVPWQFGTKYHK